MRSCVYRSKEFFDAKEAVLVYVSTEKMWADGASKPLSASQPVGIDDLNRYYYYCLVLVVELLSCWTEEEYELNHHKGMLGCQADMDSSKRFITDAAIKSALFWLKTAINFENMYQGSWLVSLGSALSKSAKACRK